MELVYLSHWKTWIHCKWHSLSLTLDLLKSQLTCKTVLGQLMPLVHHYCLLFLWIVRKASTEILQQDSVLIATNFARAVLVLNSFNAVLVQGTYSDWFVLWITKEKNSRVSASLVTIKMIKVCVCLATNHVLNALAVLKILVLVALVIDRPEMIQHNLRFVYAEQAPTVQFSKAKVCVTHVPSRAWTAMGPNLNTALPASPVSPSKRNKTNSNQLISQKDKKEPLKALLIEETD